MGRLGFDIADKVTEESNKKGVRYNYFKVEDKPKQIRFITVDGDANSLLSYSEHYVKFNNSWSRAFSCPDFMNDGPSTCIICKVKAGKNGDVQENNFGNKFIMQVIERNAKDPDPETKVVPTEGVDTLKVFKFSPFLWTTLNAFRKENGTLGDRDYRITLLKPMVNGKQKITYVVEPVTDSAAPLSKADKALLIERPSLEDIEPPYDEAEFNRLAALTVNSNGASEPIDVKSTLQEFLNTKDDDILSSLPSTKPTAAVAAAETVEVDEEDKDDDAEFFKTLRKHKEAK